MKIYIYPLIILIGCSGCQKKEPETSSDNSRTVDKQQLVDDGSIPTDANEISQVAEPNKKEALSSGAKIEQTATFEDMKNARPEDNEYLSIARDTVKNINIPADVTPELTESNDYTVITWPTDSVSEKEGFIVLSGDYHAKVRIETKTKKVVEVLVAP